MRKIETHKVNGLNEELEVQVLDRPGQGNACHAYRICVPMLDPAESHPAENSRRARTYCDIKFQNGPIKEFGVNGISNEALLAVVRDRLEGFQAGAFACETNQQALDSVVAAMGALHSRTIERSSRGVEGTNER